MGSHPAWTTRWLWHSFAHGKGTRQRSTRQTEIEEVLRIGFKEIQPTSCKGYGCHAGRWWSYLLYLLSGRTIFIWWFSVLQRASRPNLQNLGPVCEVKSIMNAVPNIVYWRGNQGRTAPGRRVCNRFQWIRKPASSTSREEWVGRQRGISPSPFKREKYYPDEIPISPRMMGTAGLSICLSPNAKVFAWINTGKSSTVD